jgi:vancomycin resistance protein YoaR
MKNSKIKFIVVTALLLLSILGYYVWGSHDSGKKRINQKNEIKKTEYKGEEIKSKPVAVKKVAVKKDANISRTAMNDKHTAKLSKDKSTSLYSEKLPWEDEKEFLAMKEKYKANIRMGAFKTVLPDPLPGEEENVSIAADKIAGTVIQPGDVFSQNTEAGPYTKSRGYKSGPTYSGGQLITTIGGGVCKIASTLYNVAILSNMGIVERHNHSMIVPYVPAGQDATVYYGSRDIKIMNKHDWPVLLWARSEGKTLYIAIYGRAKPPKITWHHEILNEKNTYNIYKKNSDLAKGTKKVIYDGYKGYTVKTWLTIEMSDGSKKTKNLGTDYYSPFPGLVEIGTRE